MHPLARRALLAVAAPALALIVAFGLVTLVLQLSGYDAFGVFGLMIEKGFTDRSIVRTLNRAVPYFFAGIAIAVGFRMALFNIGVEGQYRIAALVAAWLGAVVKLPIVLHVVFVIVVAMVVGASAAAIPAVLKVTRGVNEVVSTIMLNFILGAFGTWLLTRYLRDDGGGSNTQTEPIRDTGWMPDLDGPLKAIGLTIPDSDHVTGFLLVAVFVGVAFHVLVERTRFGFDLRASGLNPFAAAASGVSAKGMVVKAMLISGALAGLVGMPEVLSNQHAFISDTFPTQLGFTGIAVALLGRNNPIGIALAAWLFAFLETSIGGLQLEFDPELKIPVEMSLVMQGAILLTVVIAYEVVRRVRLRAEGAEVARAAEALPDETPPKPEPAKTGGEK